MDTASEPIKQSIPNRYSLVVLAAKRAKQIREGAPLLIETESANALTIALEEIAAGKIHVIEAVDVPTPMPAPTPAAPPSAMQMLDASLAEAEEAARPGALEALAEHEDHESNADGEEADAEAESDAYAGATTSVAAED